MKSTTTDDYSVNDNDNGPDGGALGVRHYLLITPRITWCSMRVPRSRTVRRPRTVFVTRSVVCQSCCPCLPCPHAPASRMQPPVDPWSANHAVHVCPAHTRPPVACYPWPWARQRRQRGARTSGGRHVLIIVHGQQRVRLVERLREEDDLARRNRSHTHTTNIRRTRGAAWCARPCERPHGMAWAGWYGMWEGCCTCSWLVMRGME
jgi:hypothetical protein